jgi:DNA-binding CsgD family transcriptional regulator
MAIKEQIKTYEVELIYRNLKLSLFCEKLIELNKNNKLKRKEPIINFLFVLYNTEIALQLNFGADLPQAERIAKRNINKINRHFNISEMTLKSLIYKKTSEYEDGFIFLKKDTMYEKLYIICDEEDNLYFKGDSYEDLTKVDYYFNLPYHSKKTRNIRRNTENRIKKDQKIDTVLCYCEQGLSVKEIIEKTGLAKNTIYKYINEEQANNTMEVKEMNSVEMKKRDNLILELAASGMSQSEIAQKLNLNQSSISRVLRKNAVRFEDALINRDIEIFDLSEQGYTQGEIARKIGTSKATVNRVLKLGSKLEVYKKYGATK